MTAIKVGLHSRAGFHLLTLTVRSELVEEQAFSTGSVYGSTGSPRTEGEGTDGTLL